MVPGMIGCRGGQVVGGGDERVGRLGWVFSSLGGVGRSTASGVDGGQPDLPMAFRHVHAVVPGDMMIDGLTPPPAGGAAAQSH